MPKLELFQAHGYFKNMADEIPVQKGGSSNKDQVDVVKQFALQIKSTFVLASEQRNQK